ncbi:hypothetical protein VaNZ11_004975, partial [Volvox africanus]
MKLTREQALAELGLQEEATEDEIKKTYKKLALQWHPDKNSDKEAATVRFQMISAAYARLSARNHPGDDDDLDDLCPEDIFDEDEFEEFEELLRSEFFYRMFFGGMRMGSGGRGRRFGGSGRDGSGSAFRVFFMPGGGPGFSFHGGPGSGRPRGGHAARPNPHRGGYQSSGGRGGSFYTYDSDSEDDDEDYDDTGSYSTVDDDDEAQMAWEEEQQARGAKAAAARKEERKRRARETEELFARSDSDRRNTFAGGPPDLGLLKFAGQQLPRPTNPGGVRSDTSIRVSLDPKKKATMWLDNGQIRFELDYKRVGEAQWTTLSSNTSATLDVTGLTPGTRYAFRGRAGTLITTSGAALHEPQWGKHSEESVFSTSGKAPSAEAATVAPVGAAATAAAGTSDSGGTNAQHAAGAAAATGPNAAAGSKAGAATAAAHQQQPSAGGGDGYGAAANSATDGIGADGAGHGKGRKKKGKPAKGADGAGGSGAATEDSALEKERHRQAEARRQEEERQRAAAAAEKRRVEVEKDAAMRSAMEAAAAEYERSVREAAAAAATSTGKSGGSGKGAKKGPGGGTAGSGKQQQHQQQTVDQSGASVGGGAAAAAGGSKGSKASATRGPENRQQQSQSQSQSQPQPQPQPAGGGRGATRGGTFQGAPGTSQAAQVPPRNIPPRSPSMHSQQQQQYAAPSTGLNCEPRFGRPPEGPSGGPYTGGRGGTGRGYGYGRSATGAGFGGRTGAFGGHGFGSGHSRGRGATNWRWQEDVELEMAIAASLKTAEQEGLIDLIDKDALAAINAACETCVCGPYAAKAVAAAPPPPQSPPSAGGHYPTLPHGTKPAAVLTAVATQLQTPSMPSQSQTSLRAPPFQSLPSGDESKSAPPPTRVPLKATTAPTPATDRPVEPAGKLTAQSASRASSSSVQPAVVVAATAAADTKPLPVVPKDLLATASQQKLPLQAPKAYPVSVPLQNSARGNSAAATDSSTSGAREPNPMHQLPYAIPVTGPSPAAPKETTRFASAAIVAPATTAPASAKPVPSYGMHPALAALLVQRKGVVSPQPVAPPPSSLSTPQSLNLGHPSQSSAMAANPSAMTTSAAQSASGMTSAAPLGINATVPANPAAGHFGASSAAADVFNATRNGTLGTGLSSTSESPVAPPGAPAAHVPTVSGVPVAKQQDSAGVPGAGAVPGASGGATWGFSRSAGSADPSTTAP